MKQSYSQKTRTITGGSIPVGIALAVAVSFIQQADAAVMVNLGSASDFAVLAGSGITIAAPVNSTTITGDIGSFPTASITGTENLILNGVNHAGDAVTEAAKTDLDTAYTDAAGQAPTTFYGAAHDLMGSLGAGVYNGTSSFSIPGSLTLDGGGDSSSVWIFQSGTSLITGSASNISLINGAQASHVFWQVGSSATLGTGSIFAGSILASESITLNTDAVLTGRALALNGAVTMDNNIIQIPEPGSTLLVGAGMLALATRRRRS